MGFLTGGEHSQGAVLRFTHLHSTGSTRPQPSPSDSPKWHQGYVLEIKDGALVVAFDEAAHWPIEEGDEYRYNSTFPAFCG